MFLICYLFLNNHFFFLKILCYEASGCVINYILASTVLSIVANFNVK